MLQDTFMELPADRKSAVLRVVFLVNLHGVRQVETFGDFTEVYAYPHGHGGTAWGINSPEGENVARGVMKSIPHNISTTE
jgi:hypothetical protein